ncbi:hypothetical protein CC85DRAFT_289379 [Cutaneotrichosporon oleaginosum]|uniref:Uncharacterized protein n=1 Tax=Cutaneotrichosporon oleaginosum TaxID=879819 RepID=A0A0J1ATF5_9TREE|nr:uncharacterized protein CC85DRAFT_289379 [Cutaneotrichosporon oleaginosum]KLT38599.1 hypothetical protein CC85DRAFT_289379 [Cutaneotrichosporon oleaginosum]
MPPRLTPFPASCGASCDRDVWLSRGGYHMVDMCSQCLVVVVVQIVTPHMATTWHHPHDNQAFQS